MSLFSVGGMIQIIFVISKILGLVNWSWWTVFIPAYIYLGNEIIRAFIIKE